jgi:uncharacterized peroxidase-related enzyme
MTHPSVPSWFGSAPDIADAVIESDIARVLAEVEEKSGFIPNVFRLLARQPAQFRAFFAYHDALMEQECSLSKAEREMIIVATSGANFCLYCVVAHGAILRIRSKNYRLSTQLATDFERAEISERQKAMLRLAMRVSKDAASINTNDFAPLYEEGFTDDDIWVIGSLASFFAMSNRLAGFTGLRPNEEFYSMGMPSEGPAQ